MNFTIQSPEVIAKAYLRIKDYIHNTPLLYSETLNNMFANQIYFKVDAMQKTGAFKIRGVLNHLLTLRESGKLPSKIVAYSTGNHALAMAYAAKLFNIYARVYLPQNVSPIKKRIAKFYGAEVREVVTRQEAEEMTALDSADGFYHLHPSDSDETIAGNGTMCYEALQYMQSHNLSLPDAIFAPCGGGGLLSGTYLAKELLSKNSSLIGAEPIKANDAYMSLQNNKIFRFQDSPDTSADGLRALSISPRTFEYLKKLDYLHLYEEEAIYHWTASLTQLLKVTCEPSAAIAMAAAEAWIRETAAKNKTLLVMITGGNIDPSFYHHLWDEDYYLNLPR
jgi:threonine dehydratase